MSDMSLPDSSKLSADRVYQFISDPDHKENLSGRVRAACLTCRRKKIKCSGEINCRTCQEKGLVCQGPPERRRPSRDAGTSLVLGPMISGRIERKRKPSKTAPRRPSVISKDDDGNSRQEERDGDTIDTADSPAATNAASQLFVKPSFSGRKTGGRPHVDVWRLGDEQTTYSPDFPPQHSPRNQAIADTDIPPTQSRGLWYSEHHPDETQAPQGLFENSDEPSESFRRQTISFPLSTPGASEARLDMSHILQNQHGVFDDMALLLANRTPRTGLTPSLTELSSIWDINSFDFLAENDLATSQSDRDPMSLSDFQTTQAMQELSCIRSTNEFDSFWPG